MSRTTAIPEAKIELPYGEIEDLCRKYGVQELSLFGSALREDFRADSDVDFLVVFRNNDAGPWLAKFMDLENDLARLLHRRVDVVDKLGVEQSENYIRRRNILQSARAIYVT